MREEMWKGFGRLHQKRTKRIGIVGLTPSCGTTHLAVAAANYFASKERMSVLYVECVPAKGVIGLRTKQIVTRRGVAGFVRDGVEFMPGCSTAEALQLLAERDEVIIVESSVAADGVQGILARCDRCIFTFSAKPWHYHTLQMGMKQMLQQQDGIAQGEYGSFALTKREEKRLYEEFHLRGTRIPYIADPYSLNRDDLRFLKWFLAGSESFG